MQLLHLVEFRIDYKISEEVLQVMHREDVVRFFVVHHLVRKQPASRKFLPLHRFSIQAAADNIECLFLQGIAVLNQFFLFPSVDQAQDSVFESGFTQACLLNFVVYLINCFIHCAAQDHIRIGQC